MSLSSNQFEPDIAAAQYAPAPRSWNRIAVLAAMFCIPFCCPPMTLIGAGTGFLALRSLKNNVHTKGAWLAKLAIGIGLFSTVMSVWFYWTSGLRSIVLGPSAPLTALFGADSAGMKQEWAGPAAELSPEQLTQFAQLMQAQFGNFVSAQVSSKRSTPLEQSWKQSMVVIPTTIIFSSGPVEADLGLERFNEKTKKSTMVWRSLRIIDSVHGDVLFPAGEPAPPPLESVKSLNIQTNAPGANSDTSIVQPPKDSPAPAPNDLLPPRSDSSNSPNPSP